MTAKAFEQNNRQRKEIQHSVLIHRSADAVSRFCRNFENQKNMLSPWIQLSAMPNHSLHWVLEAPFDVCFQGEMAPVVLAGGRLLSWRSPELFGSRYELSLEIAELSPDQLCEVHVTFRYDIPMGSLADKAFRLAKLDPEVLIEHWMEELREYLEDGWTRETGGLAHEPVSNPVQPVMAK